MLTSAALAVRTRTAALALAVAGVLTSTAALAQHVPTPAGPPPAWEATAGIGLSLTSGNSDTVNYNLAFDLARTPRRATR